MRQATKDALLTATEFKNKYLKSVEEIAMKHIEQEFLPKAKDRALSGIVTTEIGVLWETQDNKVIDAVCKILEGQGWKIYKTSGPTETSVFVWGELP